MKKHLFPLIFATCLIVFGSTIFWLSSSTAIAQTAVDQTETITVSETAESATATTIVTDTPSPTPELFNLTVKKFWQLANDKNGNGNIDPGEDVKYTIRIENSGPEVSSLVLEDSNKWEDFNPPTAIDARCYFPGTKIICNFDKIGSVPIEVSYTVTLNDTLNFQKGKSDKEIKNDVVIKIKDTPQATANAAIRVYAPTSTPTPTSTPISTETPIPTNTPILTETQRSTPMPGAQVLENSKVVTWVVATMAIVGIGVFTVVAGISTMMHDEDKDKDPKVFKEITHLRLRIFREGVIIIFIVSTVLLLAISKTLDSTGAISILSAIVGYVFGRASAKQED